MIVQAWISKITKSSKLDSSNIRKFADNLENCIEALISLNCLNEMDNQQSIRTIVEKLPRFVQHRWTSENAKCKRTRGSYAKLTDLVTFVRSTAEEMTDPVLSVASTTNELSVRKKDSKGKTFYSHSNKEAAREKDGCSGCGSNLHPIWQCPVFKGLNVEGRWDLACQNKLCFKCLGRHLSKECKRDMLCGIAGCNSDHNRLLHKSNQRKGRTTIEGEQGGNFQSRTQYPREGELVNSQSQYPSEGEQGNSQSYVPREGEGHQNE